MDALDPAASRPVELGLPEIQPRSGLTWFAEALPLTVILLLAVELRLLFRSGLAGIDALTNAHRARNLADGIWPGPGVFHSASADLALYGPAALFYRVFGSTDAATVAWPFACSLLGVACAYLIGRKLAGEAAGLFAALVWAVLPRAVASATVLSGEGPMAAFGMGVVLLIICAAWRRLSSRLAWFVVAAGMFAGFLFLRLPASAFGSSIASWSQVMFGSADYAWIAPLWIVATTTLLALRRREVYAPLLWFWSAFLLVEWSSQHVAASDARNSLLLAAPLAIVTGIYLAQNVRPGTSRWIVCAATAVVGLVAWGGVTAEADLPFATASGLATAGAIFGAMASPLFVSGSPSRWKTLAVALLATTIGIAPLNASYRGAASSRQPWQSTFPEAVRFLEHDPTLPILVPHTVFGQRLDYVSHFRLGFNSPLRSVGTRARIQLAPPGTANIRDAYILIDEDDVRDPPARWAQVARFGDREGHRLRVYRAPSTDAAGRLQAARSTFHGSRSPQTLHDLLAAATGAGESCEAAAAWHELLAADPSRARDIDPLPVVKECVAQRPDVRGANLFKNGDFARELDSWRTSPDADATVSVEGTDPATRTWHAVSRRGNGQVISQSVVLQPDTIYIYETDMRTTVPAASLVWSAGNTEAPRFFESGQLHDEWTHVTYVFLTPHWEDRNISDFSPVVLKGAGEAWLKNVRLSAFRPPPLP